MIEEISQTYSFSYTDCEGKEQTKIVKTPGPTWHECMDDYVKFLETVFGYSIRDQVRLEKPLWLGEMYSHYPDYNDPWTGEYFTTEEETDEDFDYPGLSD